MRDQVRDDPVAGGLRHREQRGQLADLEVRAPVDAVQEHPVGEPEGPGAAEAVVGAPGAEPGHEFAELRAGQAGQRTNVIGSEGPDRESHLPDRPARSMPGARNLRDNA